MKPPLHLLLLSPSRLYGQLFKRSLESLARPLVVTVLVYDEGLPAEVTAALAAGPDLVAVWVDRLLVDLRIAQALRDQGAESALLLLCAESALPALEVLAALPVAGFGLLSDELAALAALVYALADGEAPSLPQQYLRVRRDGTSRRPIRRRLSKREIETLQLVAADLLDEEIADQLGRSVRTISDSLSRIYAKLGVRGRGGGAGPCGGADPPAALDRPAAIPGVLHTVNLLRSFTVCSTPESCYA